MVCRRGTLTGVTLLICRAGVFAINRSVPDCLRWDRRLRDSSAMFAVTGKRRKLWPDITKLENFFCLIAYLWLLSQQNKSKSPGEVIDLTMSFKQNAAAFDPASSPPFEIRRSTTPYKKGWLCDQSPAICFR